ncbi:MAG: hypothetical protein AUJ07_03800 [Crenarchaeota archaeon 13_1_40CM_3_53_5]|nr:MAG: hypothetical protein AUJ07_03800 [Crenarchaeota archaeon 13_1_40CM_3_53_5]
MENKGATAEVCSSELDVDLKGSIIMVSLSPNLIVQKGADLRLQVLTFALGAGLLWSGLSEAPFREALIAAGVGFVILAYCLVLGARVGKLAKAVPRPEEPKVPSFVAPDAKAFRQPPAVQMLGRFAQYLLSILMIGGGFILVALALMWLGPSSALFASPFIPGSVLIGTGAASVIYEFLHRPRIAEFKRFCMHCGFPMTKIEIACGRCSKQPPSGIDTKVCPNCSAVVPTLAKYCRDCGAGQPPLGDG